MKIAPGDTQVKEAAAALRAMLRGVSASEVMFICIGTDRSTGDALGPLVGMKLREKGYNVMGTIHEPVHAENLAEHVTLAELSGKTIIAIDACLGQSSSIGCLSVSDTPLRPGAGVGKDLGAVGDYHITGIVNVGGFMEYFVLQNTRLSLVMKLADNIVGAITKVIKHKREKVVELV